MFRAPQVVEQVLARETTIDDSEKEGKDAPSRKMSWCRLPSAIELKVGSGKNESALTDTRAGRPAHPRACTIQGSTYMTKRSVENDFYQKPKVTRDRDDDPPMGLGTCIVRS